MDEQNASHGQTYGLDDWQDGDGCGGPGVRIQQAAGVDPQLAHLAPDVCMWVPEKGDNERLFDKCGLSDCGEHCV